MPESTETSSKMPEKEDKVNSLVELAVSLRKRKAKLTFGNLNSVKQFIKFPLESLTESSD